MTQILIPESSKKYYSGSWKKHGEMVIVDKYYFFQNQSNAKFIKKNEKCNERKAKLIQHLFKKK